MGHNIVYREICTAGINWLPQPIPVYVKRVLVRWGNGRRGGGGGGGGGDIGKESKEAINF